MKEYEVHIGPMDTLFGKGGGLRPGSGMGALLTDLPPQDEEIIVEVRDTETLIFSRARAIFHANPEEVPDWDRVWFVGDDGRRREKPWAIKILEHLELEEEAKEVKALPTRRISLAERKGRLLEELLKEREARKREKR